MSNMPGVMVQMGPTQDQVEVAEVPDRRVSVVPQLASHLEPVLYFMVEMGAPEEPAQIMEVLDWLVEEEEEEPTV